MATKTRAQLISRALERIGVLAAGQSLSAEDSALVDAQIEPLADELAAREVITLGDLEEFDTSVFHALADCLGYHVAPDFGVSLEELVGLGVDGREGGAAERRLRIITASRPLSEPVQGTYF